ncbi:MAG: hypothetical protein IPG80_10360 [Anaerolineales bacterium]|uniref:hypothetical protein n=1 Tax=Candidatus Villigracilis vicinus TaxID=3140679 RepID=UPI003134FE28|nr:hypothetical protein [Anaerolineales bacterium]
MHPIFSPFWTFTNSAMDYFLFVLIGLLLFLTITLQTQARTITGYSPRLAWIRGGIYFTSGFILSILTGVLPALFSKPIATAEQVSNLYWWLFTFLCISVIYFAYFYLWVKGTSHTDANCTCRRFYSSACFGDLAKVKSSSLPGQ